jgi:hypothetical protein
MSIKSISVVETQRDTGAPPDKRGADAKPKAEALVDAIPTEILAPYTAILAVIVANSDPGEWEVGRWVLYAISALIIPVTVWWLWRRDRAANTTRRVPVAGMFGATLAFGAWGLVMPGAPLTYSIEDDSSLTIWTFIIVTVSTLVISALPLNKQARA